MANKSITGEAMASAVEAITTLSALSVLCDCLCVARGCEWSLERLSEYLGICRTISTEVT